MRTIPLVSTEITQELEEKPRSTAVLVGTDVASAVLPLIMELRLWVSFERVTYCSSALS